GGWLGGDRRRSRGNESARVAGRRVTWHRLPGGAAAAHPRLASRIPAGLLGARFPRRARRLGGHGTRGDGESGVAAIVIGEELTLGVLQGIAVGVVLALVMLVYRTAHPYGAVLGELPRAV